MFINWGAKHILCSPAESLNPFYFRLPPRWARLNEGHKRCKWNITFSRWGTVLFFLSFPHPDWASRATCRCLLGVKVVSHMLRRALASSSLVPRQWKWVWLFCSFKSPQGCVAYRNTVSHLSAFPTHGWAADCFLTFRLAELFCRAQRNKQGGSFSGAPASLIPSDDSHFWVTVNCGAQSCEKKTGEDEEMNGVNWCEERMQRLEFRGGRQSEAVWSRLWLSSRKKKRM